MTYKELKEKLDSFTPEQLEMHVTVHDTYNYEFYPVDNVDIITISTDELDKGQPYLNF